MKKTDKNLTSFADQLDLEYGKLGTETRDKYEDGFEEFKHKVLIPKKVKNKTHK